jgi:hypothetical protein
MKRFFLLSFFAIISVSSFSQIAKDFMVGASFDLIKADYDGFFQKVQAGAEVNYFFSRKFTGTGGVEFWTNDQTSAVIGARWYPSRDAFVRLRGLIGANDISIGGGWAKPVDENFKFEALGDYYFDGQFAIRIGVAYVIRR